MKQLSLFVIAFILGITVKAQQVDVVNMLAGCDIEVTVTPYDAFCAPMTPMVQTITPGNNFIFVEPLASDFVINVVADPFPGANIVFPAITAFVPFACNPFYTNLNGATATTCGTTQAIQVGQHGMDPFNTFPNAIVRVWPL